ncbi:ABC transporter ATP-binding protein/permease [Rhodoligotrophos defluvii]|uniref:ABC transporter ATP-binding protein/permease n=1 Tax=Rhodoligotrophos defluvii TaxID=2561934 RepID=UPI001484F1E1|nr:ABC transporter ATP-binding protein/permease [Rhodoligotrophos defluvii]
MLAGTFLASPLFSRIVLLAVGIVIVVGATAYGQVKLNAWNEPFYNALSRKNLGEFLHQLVVFAVIAGGLLVLNVAQTWLNQMMQLKLREGLVRDLIGEWMQPGRAFRLSNAGPIGANPDMRIHEDAQMLTQLSTNLGIGLLQSSLLLGSFIGVLWALSDGVIFNVAGHRFGIPGYMVWCALLYAGVASWISWLVGRPLIGLNADLYAREAELRFSLVQVNENADGIALNGGEVDERNRLQGVLDAVLHQMRRIVFAVTGLTWVTAGYGWFTIVAPILVAAPGYFTGDLSFGGLMMVVGAFNQVQSALRWFVDNFSIIANWRALLLRIASFRRAVIAMDSFSHGPASLSVVRTDAEELRLEDVILALPSDSARLQEGTVAIGPGERVLVMGDSGSGKTVLFRAIGGLWPWGSGRILLPAQGVMFVPRRPYIPSGSLRAALAYPAPQVAYTDQELAAALKATHLAHLAGDLDRSARWDRELADDEQQCLAFARIYLRKPRWIVIDEAMDSLDDDRRKAIFARLAEDIPGAAIIYIGRGSAADGLFSRVLHLVKDPGMAGTVTAQPAATGPTPPSASLQTAAVTP